MRKLCTTRINRNFIAAALCMLLLMPLSPANAQPVKDLRYGVTLFHFYQDNSFDAITELLIAEKRGGIKNHGAEPLLLRGGISLSYGMRETAEHIFQQHLNASDAKTRDLAWFYNGKLAYLNAEYDAALNAFSHVKNNLPEANQHERWVLTGLSQLALKNPQQAITTFKKVDTESIWGFYAGYNRGIAHSLLGSRDNAVKAFIDTAEQDTENSEARDLQQASLLAAAYSELNANRPKQAISQFQKMSLRGEHSSAALLGYGWAAARTKNYKMAITPWKMLSEKSLYDVNAQEGLIALAYAYEQLQAKGAAADAYEHAANKLKQLLAKLDDANKNLESHAWIDTLSQEPGTSHTVNIEAQAAPETALLLGNILATQDFQRQLRHYRDLIQLKHIVRHWLNSLPSFRAMVETRHEAYDRHLNNTKPASREKNLQALLEKRQALESRLQNAIQKHDYLPLLSGDEREHWLKVQQLEKALGNNNEASEAKNRIARLKGLMQWNIEYNLAERSWQLRKKLKALDQTWASAQASQSTINGIQQNKARFVAVDNQLIEQKERQLNALDKKLDNHIQHQQTLLLKQAQEGIAQHRERINRYIAYAQLALTRLYDTPSASKAP